MDGHVTVVLNKPAIENLLHGPEGNVHRYAHQVGREGVAIARALAPKLSGRLAGSLDHHLIDSARYVELRIGSDVPYANFQEMGTGVYHEPDPHPRIDARLVTANRKVFRFRPTSSKLGPVLRDVRGARLGRRGGYVFARIIRGTPATAFLRRSLHELSARHGYIPAETRFLRR